MLSTLNFSIKNEQRAHTHGRKMSIKEKKKTYMRGFIALANELFFGLFAGLHINIDHFLAVSLE